MISLTLASDGQSPTTQADEFFWKAFEECKNDEEVDREKLRLKLISNGIEAGEAEQIIFYYLRIGAISQYNTTTLVKTVLYKELERMRGVVNTVNLELDQAKAERERKNTFKIPKEMLRRVSAGCLLSEEYAMIRFNDNGECERLIPDRDWEKENTD